MQQGIIYRVAHNGEDATEYSIALVFELSACCCCFSFRRTRRQNNAIISGHHHVQMHETIQEVCRHGLVPRIILLSSK